MTERELGRRLMRVTAISEERLGRHTVAEQLHRDVIADARAEVAERACGECKRGKCECDWEMSYV